MVGKKLEIRFWLLGFFVESTCTISLTTLLCQQLEAFKDGGNPRCLFFEVGLEVVKTLTQLEEVVVQVVVDLGVILDIDGREQGEAWITAGGLVDG